MKLLRPVDVKRKAEELRRLGRNLCHFASKYGTLKCARFLGMALWNMASGLERGHMRPSEYERAVAAMAATRQMLARLHNQRQMARERRGLETTGTEEKT